MEYYDRFEKALSAVELQLASSMPVFNAGKEYVFFYKTEETDDDAYRVTQILYVFARDIQTGAMEKMQAADCIPSELLKAATGSMNRYKVSAEEELDAEELYLENYDSLILTMTGEAGKTADRQAMAEALEKLIHSGEMKALYMHLGRDLFETL